MWDDLSAMKDYLERVKGKRPNASDPVVFVDTILIPAIRLTPDPAIPHHWSGTPADGSSMLDWIAGDPETHPLTLEIHKAIIAREKVGE